MIVKQANCLFVSSTQATHFILLTFTVVREGSKKMDPERKKDSQGSQTTPLSTSTHGKGGGWGKNKQTNKQKNSNNKARNSEHHISIKVTSTESKTVKTDVPCLFVCFKFDTKDTFMRHSLLK